MVCITDSVIFLFITVKPLWNNQYKWRWLDYNKNITMNTNLKISLQIMQNWRQKVIILLSVTLPHTWNWSS